jgi:quinol monooxygenase YgiN
VVEMTIEMELVARKRKELLLTIRDILASTRGCEGCLSCFACLDLETSKLLKMTTLWESKRCMEDYRRSKLFSALMGAIRLLCQSHHITLKDVLVMNRSEHY